MRELGVRGKMHPLPEIELEECTAMNSGFSWKFEMPEIPEDRVLVAVVHYPGNRAGAFLSPGPDEAMNLCLTKPHLHEIIMFANMYGATKIEWYTASAADCLTAKELRARVS